VDESQEAKGGRKNMKHLELKKMNSNGGMAA